LDYDFNSVYVQKFKMDGDKLVTTAEGDIDCLQTVRGYSLPLRIDVSAMTDSEIRLYYLMGEVMFNYDRPEQFHDHDIITGAWNEHLNKPPLPVNKFVDISWVIEKEYMEVLIDGELFYRCDKSPYIEILHKSPDVSKIQAPVRVSAANGSTVTIKSLKITELLES
jgi:hypothetical protein